MDDILGRREAARPPRRLSTAADVGGATAGPQDGEVTEERPGRRTMERGDAASLAIYRRYMPMEPLKFPIPRKTREKRGGLLPFLMRSITKSQHGETRSCML